MTLVDPRILGLMALQVVHRPHAPVETAGRDAFAAWSDGSTLASWSALHLS